ncbi:MAG: guanylate kinase [Firmicutes bacterium]|nr:guanylate kinase [Bacillota bacterium]
MKGSISRGAVGRGAIDELPPGDAGGGGGNLTFGGREGLLLVLSGPSGVGKDTAVQALLQADPTLSFGVSVTTRKPRAGELDGKDYIFVSETLFKTWIAEDRFLEWAWVHGNLYGTPRDRLLEALTAGRDIVLRPDVQGALRISENFPDACMVFLLPPTWKELRARMEKRGGDSGEEMEQRIDAARREFNYLRNYDYVVINDRLEDAVTTLLAIVRAERCKVHRNKILLGPEEEISD